MIKEAIERLMQSGRDAAGVKIDLNTGGEPFAVKADGQIVEMAKFFPPRRIKQTATFLEVGSFAAYVNRFRTSQSLIFATLTEQGATFKAILDYHAVQKDLVTFEAQRCEHVAVFSLVATPDWQSWTEQNREAIGQVDFATWLEDMQHVFLTPSGSEFLELVRNLHGRKDAAFNQSFRADNGAFSVAYQENIEVQSTTSSGTIKLPEKLSASIQLFEGLTPKVVEARLKVRIDNRKLFLFFETIQIEKLVRDAIMASVVEISEKTTIVPMLGAVQ